MNAIIAKQWSCQVISFLHLVSFIVNWGHNSTQFQGFWASANWTPPTEACLHCAGAEDMLVNCHLSLLQCHCYSELCQLPGDGACQSHSSPMSCADTWLVWWQLDPTNQWSWSFANPDWNPRWTFGLSWRCREGTWWQPFLCKLSFLSQANVVLGHCQPRTHSSVSNLGFPRVWASWSLGACGWS